jgi:hypothetical protein
LGQQIGHLPEPSEDLAGVGDSAFAWEALTSPGHGEMAIQNVRSLGVPPLAEALALARRLVQAAPDPSHARELALALVRLLEERQAARPDTAEVG